MGADSSAQNTPNAPEFICPICLPKPKSCDFNEKRLHRVSIVRDSFHTYGIAFHSTNIIDNACMYDTNASLFTYLDMYNLQGCYQKWSLYWT